MLDGDSFRRCAEVGRAASERSSSCLRKKHRPLNSQGPGYGHHKPLQEQAGYWTLTLSCCIVSLSYLERNCCEDRKACLFFVSRACCLISFSLFHSLDLTPPSSSFPLPHPLMHFLSLFSFPFYLFFLLFFEFIHFLLSLLFPPSSFPPPPSLTGFQINAER